MRRVGAGREDVEVAAGFAAAPQAADRRRSRRPAHAPAEASTSAAACSCASGSRWRPACRLRSSSALRISASFFAPMPRSARMRPSRRGPLEIVERADAELAVERRHGLRARRPAGAADRGSTAGTRRRARGGRPRRRSRRSRGSGPRDPCRCRESRAARWRRASPASCGWLATMSAPLRYARILNGLSFLISRRSAISRRMRAIARLSNPQAFRLDAVVEQARAAARERGGDRGRAPGGP